MKFEEIGGITQRRWRRRTNRALHMQRDRQIMTRGRLPYRMILTLAISRLRARAHQDLHQMRVTRQALDFRCCPLRVLGRDNNRTLEATVPVVGA